MNDVLRVTGLKKSYSGPVLNGVSFSLDEAGFTAIIGPSGSGKSTLLNIIAGLERADAGSVFFEGKEISSAGPEAYAALRLSKISIVFQFFNLLPTLTIEQNVQLPSHLSGRPLSKLRKRAEELFEQMGIGSIAKRLPHEVSGGELQRAAVARALMNEPALILADEPTGNLDRKNGENILAILEDVPRTYGAALLVVTHDQTVIGRASRVLRLEDGVIVR